MIRWSPKCTEYWFDEFPRRMYMPEVSERSNKVADWRADEAVTERFAAARVAVSLRIYCHAGQKTPIYDAGRTIAIGPFGAVMTVAAPVVVDELVLLIHPRSGREMVCRVNAVEASGSGLYQVVLEFSEEAPDFWGVEIASLAAPVPAEAPQVEKPAAREAQKLPVGPSGPVVAVAKPSKPGTPTPPPVAAHPVAPAASNAPAANKAATRKNAVPPVPVAPADPVEVVSTNGAEDSSAEANATEFMGRWRTPRLHLETRVQVCLPGESKPVDCTTINIGASSALLQLSHKVSVGQGLILKNPTSRDEIACQVRYVKELSPQLVQAGVEFVKEAKRFWGITFPPENWDPSERKRPGKRS